MNHKTLIANGPLRGQVIEFPAHSLLIGQRPSVHGSEPEQIAYQRMRVTVFGRVLWVGVAGLLLPPQEELADLLLSEAAKTCAE